MTHVSHESLNIPTIGPFGLAHLTQTEHQQVELKERRPALDVNKQQKRFLVASVIPI